MSPRPAHCHHMKAWLVDVGLEGQEGAEGGEESALEERRAYNAAKTGRKRCKGRAFIGSANLQMATLNGGHSSETPGRPTVCSASGCELLAFELGACASELMGLGLRNLC